MRSHGSKCLVVNTVIVEGGGEASSSAVEIYTSACAHAREIVRYTAFYMARPLTLCVVHTGGQVLLGMKKRGFGVGKWNGFGGKVEEGETIQDAARRETLEEAGIIVRDLKELGVNIFTFKHTGEVHEVHVFEATDFEGTPREGEEMRPQWFSVNKIPYTEMWPDDVYWLPLFLAGKKFRGTYLFGEGDTLLSFDLREVE